MSVDNDQRWDFGFKKVGALQFEIGDTSAPGHIKLQELITPNHDCLELGVSHDGKLGQMRAVYKHLHTADR